MIVRVKQRLCICSSPRLSIINLFSIDDATASLLNTERALSSFLSKFNVRILFAKY